MADIGMCFQAPLVRAFLAGRKSQTRRTLTASRCLVDGAGMSAKRWAAMQWDWSSAYVDDGPSPAGNPGPYLHVFSRAHLTTHRIYPRAQVGDRMWVRETWQYANWTQDGEPLIRYCADGETRWAENAGDLADVWAALSEPENYAIDNTAADRRWRTSIHMPRWASRIQRDIVRLRFERLQDISDGDAIAEGVDRTNTSIPRYARERFRILWESINGAGSWSADPLLLVYDFAEANLEPAAVPAKAAA